MSDLNYVEDSAGGPDVTVGILAKMDKVTLLQVKRSRFLIIRKIQNSSIAQACLYMQQWLHISTFFCKILFLYCDCLLHSVIFTKKEAAQSFFFQMDAKLPMDTFENVMGLAIEGCKAIATHIREVHIFLLLFCYSRLQLI